ncbi:hypothetical protein B0H17DRAFT_1126527 [Mycena rosella]|uniref:Uncharacterized protein n=1 Tax=Mycena rosella TaxID=1033263 RepID=A0AAD7GTR0_MYCRO|nr:hypothetical protein B0H17DRAFT_1126527 [Mycena rosella]
MAKLGAKSEQSSGSGKPGVVMVTLADPWCKALFVQWLRAIEPFSQQICGQKQGSDKFRAKILLEAEFGQKLGVGLEEKLGQNFPNSRNRYPTYKGIIKGPVWGQQEAIT